MSRAHPGMDHMTTGGKAGNQWTYKTKHPIEVIDADHYWDGIWNNVAETDEIKVYAFRPDGGFYRATFVILHSETGRVIAEREADWRLFSLDVQGVELVDRSTDGRDLYDVIETRTGRTLKRGVDRVTASALARAYAQPKPIDQMDRDELQKEHQRLAGKGFKVGTPIEDMRAAVVAAATAKAA